MNRRVSFFIFLLITTLSYWLYIQNHQEQVRNAVAANKPAPDFTVKSEKGKQTTLAEHKGKLVMIHFWATWCPPCAHEFPHLVKLYQTLPKDKFVLLALSEDEGGPDVIQKFRKSVIDFPFDVYMDVDYSVAERYGTYGLPETFLVDAEGMVIRKYVGPQEWDSKEMMTEIRKYLPK